MKFVIFFLTAFLASYVSSAKWDGLRVRWNLNITNPDYFVSFPRIESQAVNKGFTQIGNCDLTAKWRGSRYVKGDDYTFIVLYDVNGYIAGVQTAVTLTPTYPPLKLKPPFIDDGDRSYLTIYFTDPAKICTTGRSAEEFATEGTGSFLYIQNSTSPEASTRLFSTIEEAERAKPWSVASCLTFMGLHYYYNITLELPCDELFPVGLLFNNGQLHGFAWLFLATLPFGQYERTPKAGYRLVINPVPTCFNDFEYITTQHVYLIDNFKQLQCPKE